MSISSSLPLIRDGRSLLRRVVARIVQMQELRAARLALARLDDHLLRDIGLSAAEAQEEAERAPWDAPAHWRR